MKLKRFLSLAVSLAMVLSMVPAFSLTASAAVDATWISTDTLVYDGTQTDSAYAQGEKFIAVEFTLGTLSGYKDLAMTDADGKKIAGFCDAWLSNDGFYVPDGERSAAADNAVVSTSAGNIKFNDYSGNARIRALIENTGSQYTVEYSVVDGIGGSVIKTFATMVYSGTANGISLPANWNYGGWGSGVSASNASSAFADFRVFAYTPDTVVNVTATYTVNGETVKTVTNSYDTANAETAASFDAVYNYSNGTNAIYCAEATTLSESAIIELTTLENPDVAGYENGKIFANGGVQYEVKSGNLVPNGDFSLGRTGWYASDGSEAGTTFTTNASAGTITTSANTGAAGASSLWRAWATEVGKTYVFTYDSSAKTGYFVVSEKADLSATSDGTSLGTAVTGTNTIIYTAKQPYVQINFRWIQGKTMGNFGLYEIAEAETVVAEEVASYTIPAATVIGDTTPILATTATVTGSLGSTATGTVVWNDAPDTYPAGDTTVNGTMTVQFGDAEAIETAVTTTVTVLPETFTLADLTSGGTDNVSYFPVAISDEFSLEFTMNASNYDNLWIYISNNGALWGGGQIGLGWDANETGYFRAQPAAQTNVQFATGNDYRLFVTGSAATDTYDLTVYDLATNSVIFAIEDYGFRSGSDVINSIAFTPNGENGVGTMSDIKVYSATWESQKQEYTINLYMNGEAAGSTTVTALTAEAAQAGIANIENYQREIVVDGTTINVYYTSTQVLKATFIDADENVIKEVSEVVALGETYTVAAEEIFFLDVNYNGYFYQIPKTVLSADNNNLVVTVTETANKYAVMEDMLVSDNEVWGMRATNSNSVFVAAGADANRGAYVDANGENAHDANHTPSTLGKSRVGFMQFPVVDVTEGQKVTANFYVRTWHDNTFSNSNATIRFTATAINDDSWVELSDGGSYDSANAPVFEGWTTPVFSPVCYKNVGYVAVDVTEIMMAAKAAGLDTITLKLNIGYGAAYIAEREAAVVGGAYAGKAAYIAVEDAGLVKVTETGNATLTKNGSEMNGFAYVAASDDVRLNASGAIVVNTDAGYYEANKTMSIAEATDFANTVPAGLGLAMVSGAQVRIGAEDLGEGEKLDALSDSGIRFLATADYADTVLADDTVEFGIKVQAESSDAVVYVKAEQFQNDDNNVFSAAITNMKESNYNRKYTACAYAKVTMADGTVKEFTTDSVTRSIYQVSAGIMKNGSADADNAAYTVDGVVKNVLNAYVNQTGIRLGYNGTEMTVEDGKYTGDVFFTVTSEPIEGGVKVTITPDTTWGTPAEIATWWADYVRVNNNHTAASAYIEDAQLVDGVLTFNFMYVAE